MYNSYRLKAITFFSNFNLNDVFVCIKKTKGNGYKMQICFARISKTQGAGKKRKYLYVFREAPPATQRAFGP